MPCQDCLKLGCHSASARRQADTEAWAAMQDMPFIQVIILWIALVCDIASKVSVTIQTWRFVHTGHYWWAAFILLFFVLSSIVSACYWATHYPGGIADQAVQMAALQPIEGECDDSMLFISACGRPWGALGDSWLRERGPDQPCALHACQSCVCTQQLCVLPSHSRLL